MIGNHDYNTMDISLVDGHADEKRKFNQYEHTILSFVF